MKNYTISYAITDGLTLEADTEAEAIEKFNSHTELDLFENANPSEITGIFVEDTH